MTQPNQLDAFVDCVRARYEIIGPAVISKHDVVRNAADAIPHCFSQALQDPRYIAYCKEQDRKDTNRNMNLLRTQQTAIIARLQTWQEDE